jgi:glycosyltransferase involved in cell wall biosynthesis
MLLHVLDDRAVSRLVGVLSVNLSRQGASVVVVCGSSTPAGRAILPAGVEVEDLGIDPDRRSIYAAPRLAGWLRRRRPVALFAHGEGPGRAALVASGLTSVPVRVIVVEHTHTATFRPPGVARRTMTRLLYRRAALVAAVSPGVGAELERRIPAWRGRTIVLPSVAPDPASLSARAGAPANHPWFEGENRPFVVVCAANIVARKGQDTLVRALPAIRSAVGDVRLLLVGRLDEPDFAATLRDLADELDVADHVCLAGYREDALPLIARGHVAALASHTEGLPMFLLEAMACGLPVVSTDCPVGPSYLLEGGKSGLLVPVGNPDLMAQAIIRLASDSETRSMFVARGKSRAASFTPSEVASRYLDAVARVTAGAVSFGAF